MATFHFRKAQATTKPEDVAKKCSICRALSEVQLVSDQIGQGETVSVRNNSLDPSSSSPSSTTPMKVDKIDACDKSSSAMQVDPSDRQEIPQSGERDSDEQSNEGKAVEDFTICQNCQEERAALDHLDEQLDGLYSAMPSRSAIIVVTGSEPPARSPDIEVQRQSLFYMAVKD